MRKRTYKTVAGLLGDPSRWCKGENALDKNGRIVNPDNKDAVKFCLSGAIFRVYGSYDAPEAGEVMTVIAQKYRKKYSYMYEWNDSRRRTHEEVLSVVKLAKI